MYSPCAHHLTSIVKTQKEICIGDASTTNKWWQLLTTATGMTEIDKAQSCDVDSEIDETHPTSTCRNIGHGTTCWVSATAVKCAYREWWEQDHLQRSSRAGQTPLGECGPGCCCRAARRWRAERRRRGLVKEVYYMDVRGVLLGHYVRRTILSTRPIQQRTRIHSEAVMGTLPNHVSHTPAGHTILSLSLCATCTVYRTISRASGLFNVVIQAEHNCVPPSDRRLRTSSLLTKKPATLRWGQAHLREEIFLRPPPPSFSLFLFLLAGWKERFKG